MPSKLLGNEHTDTNVQEILAKIREDDLAFYDARKNVRQVPVFKYDPVTNEPIALSHWQTRYCAPPDMRLVDAQLKGLDVYIEGRGWIRAGKKAERDARYD